VEQLKSRKLWVTIVSGILVTLGQQFGLELDGEQLISLGLMVAAYIGGQAAVDHAKVKAEVAAGVDQLKLEANTIIAALTAKLQEVSVAPAPSVPDANTELA
jgi:uncharacterized membrane protein (DUF441 family)